MLYKVPDVLSKSSVMNNEKESLHDIQILDPELEIIDAHHHLWDLPGSRYLFDELLGDLNSGHRIEATVYVECSAMYRSQGPEELKVLGEAEFVAGMAAMSNSGRYGPTRICAAFVGAADLTLGNEVDAVLDGLATCSGQRLRGIRSSAIWDADPSVNTGTRPFAPKGILSSSSFRRGFERLAAKELSYDAWQYHPQIPEVISLAKAFPDTPIIINHVGGLLGIGPYAKSDLFQNWKTLIQEASEIPNIYIKLGGLAAKRCGFDYGTQPTETQLVHAWGPYIKTCIDLFGPERCLFQTNFPPDKVAGSYSKIWNVFKKIAVDYSPSEKKSLFNTTAKQLYKIK